MDENRKYESENMIMNIRLTIGKLIIGRFLRQEIFRLPTDVDFVPLICDRRKMDENRKYESENMIMNIRLTIGKLIIGRFLRQEIFPLPTYGDFLRDHHIGL